jgi:LytS/YehU family sensor histidine kinase
MHPILASRRLLFYLLAWLPAGALLTYLTWAGGGFRLPQAAAVVAPACFVYAFACLSPWYLCRTRPFSLEALPELAVTFCAAAAAGGLLLAGIAWVVAQELKIDSTGHLPLWFGVGALLYLLSTGLHYAGLAAEESRAAEARAAEARTLAREAELQALRLQIHPHFLFNSLHSIAALASVDGARAREMCIRLSDFLRISLGLGSRPTIPLGEELDLARNYLELERVRFSDRLRVEIEIEAGCENCAVPALLLQPLVENAVKHGIAGLVEGGTIRLEARRDAPGVVVTVTNPFDPEAPPPERLGVGLAQVRRRLEVRYGPEARLDTGTANGAYRVVLRLPCEAG